MKLELVKATASDINFLLQLRELTMGKYLTEIGAANDKASYLKRILYNFEDAQLVMINGQPAGLFKSSFIAEKDHWYLVQIQVHPDFQNLGIGKILITTLLEHARAEGKNVLLSVLKNNPAKALYYRLGFRTTEENEYEYVMEYQTSRKPV
ncbi:GNAT family N-acetyltransferase [Pectobacteriaceae bacterium CE90]|nr:GNAT family N-acetyltransferase [Pectobacteriaceae bacterium CE90]